MKSTSFYLLSFFIVADGCKKPVEETPVPTKTFEVRETFTENPIERAEIILEKCGETGPFGGCYNRSLVASGYTDKNGKANFTISTRVDEVTIKHKNYWTTYSTTGGIIHLDPKCIIKTTIKQLRRQLPNDKFWICVITSPCPNPYCIFLKTNIGLPNDTTIFLEGRGFRENSISWNLESFSADYSSPLTYIRGFDTAFVKIEY